MDDAASECRVQYVRTWATSSRSMLERNVRDADRCKPQSDQQRLLRRFDRFRATVKARNQIGDGDVEEARRRYRKDGRQDTFHPSQGTIRGQRADQRGESCADVERECFLATEARVQQDREIADLLRYGVRDDRERRCDAERVIREKRSGDDDAVAEIVNAIADQ